MLAIGCAVSVNIDLIRFIFSCFGIFANTIYYLHIRYKIFLQIRVEANICFRASIRFTFSHTGEYSFQNICFDANICKASREFHICLQIFAYKWIFICKYSHTGKYSLCIASNYIGKPLTSLRPHLIFRSFSKYSLHFVSKYSLWSKKIINIHFRFNSFLM
jgi:hypothetical protein